MKSPTGMRVWCALAASCAVITHAAKLEDVYSLMHQQQQQQQMQAHDYLSPNNSKEHTSHRDRLPTQPIHRSILSHRKRTIHVANEHRNLDNIANGAPSSSLRVEHRNADAGEATAESTENENTNNDEDEYQYTHNNGEKQSPSSKEPIPSLLTSEWWVKIQEEVGQTVYNYVPESRRAASSVVFRYTQHNNKHGRSLDGDQNNNGYKDDKLNAGQNITNIDHENIVDGGADNIEGIEDKKEELVHKVEELAKEVENEIGGKSPPINEQQGKQITPEENVNDKNNTEQSKSSSKQQPKQSGAKKPATTTTISEEGEEYMITSGGYTDHDWKTFPVYAFPISSSINTGSGQWIDLSPDHLEVANPDPHCNEEDGAAAREQLYRQTDFLDVNNATALAQDPWKHNAQNCPPSGRMGHQSVAYNDRYLYVFGGLIYDGEQAGSYGRKETFRLEDVPFVYRLDLKEMFEARLRAANMGDASNAKVTGWQRIIPRVKPFPTPAGMSSTTAAEVLLTSINRGEMDGGLWSSESSGGHDKFVMYGGLKIQVNKYEGPGHNGPSKFVKGETTFGYDSQQMHSQKVVELPLGDVWAYDLVTDCWEKLTNNYGKPIEGEGKDTENSGNPTDDDLWYDVDITSYPRPRTAHAAAVVGNDLVIHGGMGWNEHTNDWDGSTDWETLSDMWILDLNTRQWKRRYLFPQLVRSYHSLVGWHVDESMMKHDEAVGNATTWEGITSWDGPVVAAFGGYTTGVDVFSGEELAYVFDDLLISYPPTPGTNFDEPPSPWLKAYMNMERDGAELISTRYEHSAVLSPSTGVMTVWGGSFQNTKFVKGVWMINIAGVESKVSISLAESDNIYDDFERTITALHTIVLMLMFMSISLTLLLGLTQRYQELVQQANEDAAGMVFNQGDFGSDSPPARRGNGIAQEIIDTIPSKIYNSSDNSGDNAGNEEECGICLLEYEDGDELRVLPCGHFMHKTCLDAWLANNPSCPSCRHSLSELVDDSLPMMQLRTLRSRLANNTALARFLGEDDYDVEGIEMTASSGGNAVVDLRYVSSLALSEEDTTADQREENQSQGDTTEGVTAMDELSSWRSRRRQLQRDRRRSRFSTLRSNVTRIRGGNRGSRVPLADLDEDSEQA